MEFYIIPPRMRNQRRRNQCRRRRIVQSNPLPTSLSINFDDHHQPSSTMTVCSVDKTVKIQQVWASNLLLEFQRIRMAIDNGFNIVALDTEFPGCPYVPQGVDADYRKRSCEDHYSVMKINVDRLKIIQVGITLMDASGNLPRFGSGKRVLWEFNFCDFDINTDECVKESVDLLTKQGIDFQLHKKFGIRSTMFARLMVLSGLIGRSAAWITFQGGIDLAYLMKMLIQEQPLPNNLEFFTGWMKYYFGSNIFDVKHMIKSCNSLYGGLNKVAETLKVERDARESHRAGSDSLLTGMVFHKIMQEYFPAAGEGLRFAGKLHTFVV